MRRRSTIKAPGATLIELLVVISLIGLLIGMLVPSVTRSMDLAKATICKHRLSELGRAISEYQYDNSGWLPTSGPPKIDITGSWKTEPWFSNLFYDYLSDPVILTCPKDPFGYRMAEYHEPLNIPKAGNYASYGMNSFLTSAGNGAFADSERLRPRRPSDTILIADSGPDNDSSPSAATNGPTRNSSMLSWDDGYDPLKSLAPPNPWLTMRHGHGIHLATLEGGVREAGTQSIMHKPVHRYYRQCAAGGCTFCKQLLARHYSFAKDHLYWYTGFIPVK